MKIDIHKLNHHMALFGATGSGKTGLLFTVVEDLIREEVPTILVDIKGDIPNLVHQNGNLDTDIRILTPGGLHGEPVDLFSALGEPARASKAISNVLEFVGLDPDPFKSANHAFLHAGVEVGTTIQDLVDWCLNPSIKKLGVLPLDESISPQARKLLAKRLNNLASSQSFQKWNTGLPLDLDLIGNTSLIYSVAHLEQPDMIFALTFLLEELNYWMSLQSGTDALRVVLVIDECRGLCPPYPHNPPTKDPLMRLVRLGRSFGVGVVLSSQNSKDLDYKALSNCQTRVMGKLSTALDRKRALEGIDIDKSTIKQIEALPKRNFFLHDGSQQGFFTSRDTETRLTGPMTCANIEMLFKQGFVKSEYVEQVQPVSSGIVNQLMKLFK